MFGAHGRLTKLMAIISMKVLKAELLYTIVVATSRGDHPALSASTTPYIDRS